jgi:hypothetical protein
MQLGVMRVNTAHKIKKQKRKKYDREPQAYKETMHKKTWHICERKQTRRCNRHGSRQKMQVKGRDAMGNISTRA